MQRANESGDFQGVTMFVHTHRGAWVIDNQFAVFQTGKTEKDLPYPELEEEDVTECNDTNSNEQSIPSETPSLGHLSLKALTTPFDFDYGALPIRMDVARGVINGLTKKLGADVLLGALDVLTQRQHDDFVRERISMALKFGRGLDILISAVGDDIDLATSIADKLILRHKKQLLHWIGDRLGIESARDMLGMIFGNHPQELFNKLQPQAAVDIIAAIADEQPIDVMVGVLAASTTKDARCLVDALLRIHREEAIDHLDRQMAKRIVSAMLNKHGIENFIFLYEMLRGNGEMVQQIILENMSIVMAAFDLVHEERALDIVGMLVKKHGLPWVHIASLHEFVEENIVEVLGLATAALDVDAGNLPGLSTCQNLVAKLTKAYGPDQFVYIYQELKGQRNLLSKLVDDNLSCVLRHLEETLARDIIVEVCDRFCRAHSIGYWEIFGISDKDHVEQVVAKYWRTASIAVVKNSGKAGAIQLCADLSAKHNILPDVPLSVYADRWLEEVAAHGDVILRPAQEIPDDLDLRQYLHNGGKAYLIVAIDPVFISNALDELSTYIDIATVIGMCEFEPKEFAGIINHILMSQGYPFLEYVNYKLLGDLICAANGIGIVPEEFGLKLAGRALAKDFDYFIQETLEQISARTGIAVEDLDRLAPIEHRVGQMLNTLMRITGLVSISQLDLDTRNRVGVCIRLVVKCLKAMDITVAEREIDG
jgi:hypothetical protein